MSILSKVSTGRIQAPHFMVVYGPDGVGKTTFAAGAPKPIFLSSENGTNSIDTARLRLTSLDEVHAALGELATEKHDYQTVVIDSLDWLEPTIWASVIAAAGKKDIQSLEDFGYGKGYAYALDEWKKLMPRVEALRARGLNFIAIAHSKVKMFQDPSTPQGYDRFSLKLHEGAAALWREAVDTVLFANFVTNTTTDDKRRGFGDGTRVCYTERRPGFDAKNRLGLPFKLPFDWASYEAAARLGQPEATATLKETIEALLEQVPNKETKAKATEAFKKAGTNAAQLAAIKNRLLAVLGEKA